MQSVTGHDEIVSKLQCTSQQSSLRFEDNCLRHLLAELRLAPMMYQSFLYASKGISGLIGLKL
jgi:hypothetical protein